MRHRVAAAARRLWIGHTTAVAYLALVLASSGVAYAAATIGSAEVINNSLRSVDMADGLAVGGIDVINDSLTGADIKEATLVGSVKKILYDATTNASLFPTLVVVGPYNLVLECRAPESGGPRLRLWVNGPLHAVYAHGVVRPDGSVPEDFLYQTQSQSNGQTPLFMDVPDAESVRHTVVRAGTLTVTSGTTVAQIDFHTLVTVDRNAEEGRGTTRCQVYGAAVLGV